MGLTGTSQVRLGYVLAFYHAAVGQPYRRRDEFAELKQRRHGDAWRAR